MKRHLVFDPDSGLWRGWHMRRGAFTVEGALVEAAYQSCFDAQLWLALHGLAPFDNICARAGEGATLCSRWSWQAGTVAGVEWATREPAPAQEWRSCAG